MIMPLEVKLSKDNIDDLYFELLQCLLEPTTSRLWLQKVVNLLKQLINADYVILNTFLDNQIVIAAEQILYAKAKNEFKFSGNNYLDSDAGMHCYWCEGKYIVSLHLEGALKIFWDKKPAEEELSNYSKYFIFLVSSLKRRADLIITQGNGIFSASIENLEKILTCKIELRNQIKDLLKEVGVTLNVSRAQVKVFSKQAVSGFDTKLTAEYVASGFLEALSVVPATEKLWIDKLLTGEFKLLDYKSNVTENDVSKNIESVLSIKSIFGYPILYKGEVVGVLVLHQCDYERKWKSEEVAYVKQVVLLIGLAVGNEVGEGRVDEAYLSGTSSSVIDADDFLRFLGHCQIEANLSAIPFSLLMIDIEKLRDINLNMGFVAGNLVLSQTARYINRLYGGAYKLARYSNDEFVVIMQGVDQTKARLESEKLKEYLSNVSVLGVGPVDYNFSFATYPTHTDSIAELLNILEQGMILSKSRGTLQISGYDEIHGQPKERWKQLVSHAIPEIIVKKSSLKTGPEIIETIKKQVEYVGERSTYNADILDSVQSLALALDAKDSYTEGHSKRVSEYAYILAKNIGLELQEIEWVRLAAMMHDIGKIGIPEGILCKPGKLTREEFEVMKKHPVIGAKILNPIGPLEKVANLVLYHHEYWDGSGYPNGICKFDIPVGSRIVSIVDAYQAMTSNRPYRASLSFEEAVRRLREGKEKQWDPDLVELFISVVS